MPVIAAPQPIPYQGSKRKLAPLVLKHFPASTTTLFEPFAGSAAITIAAAQRGLASSFVISDSLPPLIGIWNLILTSPTALADGYEALWHAQIGNKRTFYDQTREEFNAEKDPIKLLYLLARCVKNAVRFNSVGAFNQSPDNRRKGVKPATLRKRIWEVHGLLSGRTKARAGDYEQALADANPDDLVYMDPPYMGVSGAKDGRYHQGLDIDRFVEALGSANDRGVRYLVSFDGRKGNVTYGPPLPDALCLRRLELHAGRSSQATLNGKAEETYESLYLSAALVECLRSDTALQDQHSVHRVRPMPDMPHEWRQVEGIRIGSLEIVCT